MKTPFLGSAYTARSPNLANQQLINLYPEIVESKSGKEIGGFYMTPGLTTLATAGAGPIKAMANFANLYVLSGTTIYQISPTYVVTSVGTATGPGPYVFIATDNQLALFDGTGGYIFTIASGAFVPITLPFSNPFGAAELNGFGIVSVAGEQQWWQSDLDDLSTWDALNFSNADATADGIIAVTQLHNQLIFLKTFHIEFWVNAGLPGVAFQRLPGVLPSVGCLAVNSVATLADRILWLGIGPEGYGIIYEMSGYEPKRVSTHAIETAIAAYGVNSDAIAFGYQQEGHSFYQISFPTGGTTFVLDLTASAQMGFPVWHQRAYWTGSAFARHPANVFALWNGTITLGDYQNGNIYAYQLSQPLDGGASRRWLRSWRAIPQQIPESAKCNQLEIEYEPGIGVVGNPTWSLRQSFDGGANWSTAITGTPGTSGQTLTRVRFRRLGMKRRGMISDRIFELSGINSSANQMTVALMGGEIR